MTEQSKATLATITIVAGLALIGYLAYLRIDGAGMAAVGVVVALVSWFTRTPDRKDPPSGTTIVPLVAAGAVLASLFACGCSSPPPTPAQAAAETAYGGALLRCVDAAKTLAESKACRARVDAEWGVTQTAKDGGQ